MFKPLIKQKARIFLSSGRDAQVSKVMAELRSVERIAGFFGAYLGCNGRHDSSAASSAGGSATDDGGRHHLQVAKRLQ